MSIRPVITIGHPTLRLLAKSVDLNNKELLQQLRTDLTDTMRHLNGLGLAAPQIDESWQVAAIERPRFNPRYPNINLAGFDALFEKTAPGEPLLILNPTITPLSEEKQGHWEGCLSVPNLRGFVEREARIRVTFWDDQKHFYDLELFDFASVVFQHECDHLFGKLFVDYISSPENLRDERHSSPNTP